MGEALLLGLAIGLPITVWLISKYRTKSHAQSMDIVAKLVERGDQIDEQTIKALGVKTPPPERDLKIGMILVAVASALFIFAGLLNDDREGQIFLRGIASFPLMVGIVYCAFWLMFGRKKP